MLAAQRRQFIVEWLDREGSVSVRELADRFGVSEVTIRQDLKRLEDRGLLNRIHGGALIKHRSGVESTLADRRLVASAEKRQIASRAAETVEHGDVVMLTDGTSTLQLAYELKKKDVTIVTNGWNIVAELGQEADAKIVCLGGMLRHVTMSYIGPLTLAAIDQLRVDKLFFGVDGFTYSHGFTTPNMMECEVQRAMMRSAKHITALVDHTKIGREYLYRIASVDEVDTVIFDDRVPSTLVGYLKEQEVEVIVARQRSAV